jgi:hypothetical protein
MSFLRTAKLGLAGRYAFVCVIECGMSLKRPRLPSASRRRPLSVGGTAGWRRARLSEGAFPVSSIRSSRPTRSPRRLAQEAERAIRECRPRTGWGPRLLAGATGFCHSTVWKVLRRFGLSHSPRPPREPANRYESPCPGASLVRCLVRRRSRWPGTSCATQIHSCLIERWFLQVEKMGRSAHARQCSR